MGTLRCWDNDSCYKAISTFYYLKQVTDITDFVIRLCNILNSNWSMHGPWKCACGQRSVVVPDVVLADGVYVYSDFDTKMPRKP